MKIFTKDEIVEQAKELAKMISETEEVDFFKRAEAQIHKNENVKRTIIRPFISSFGRFTTETVVSAT